MTKSDDRITELEIQLSHQTKVIEDLSDEVARQNKQIAKLTRRVELLIENAAEAESGGGVILADQKPPHW